MSPWSVEVETSDTDRPGMPLERILEIVDIDRMDILDTMIRTIINGTELPFVDAVLALRSGSILLEVNFLKRQGQVNFSLQ